MENSSSISLPIHSWAIDDQPRERLLANGVAALSNSELLSIILNVGTKDRSALELSKDILTLASNNLDELAKLSVNDMQVLKGIGEAKSAVIAAVFELGKRRHLSTPLNKICVRSSHEIANYLKVLLKDYSYEVFAIVLLNRANRIKSFEVISRGGLTGTVADPRIILKKAVLQEATSIILTHNHPSGNLIPSKADEELTQKIKHAASYFDINVLDHVIVSDEGYYSFADEGMI